MATYLIAVIDVKDVQRYDAEYVAGVQPLIQKHGGRLLVVAESMDVMEGQWPPGRTIVIEFPDAESARAWYSDPDYQPLLKLRLDISAGMLGFADIV
jgi:uncharacterized protein (DUF1330 family)